MYLFYCSLIFYRSEDLPSVIMRISIQSSIFILAIVFIIAILAYSIFRGSSSGAALPSIKSLNPSYPYTRRTTIKHVDFKPATFQQTQDPAFDYKKTVDELIENKNDMYNQQMILIIRNYLIQQPTLEPYSLQNKDLFDYSGGQSATVDNVLRFKVSTSSLITYDRWCGL